MRFERSEKIRWTEHSRIKMRYYHLSEQRVKRVIRHPMRTEKGILDTAIAVMQRSESKAYSEIWVMYVIEKGKNNNEDMGIKNPMLVTFDQKIRVITAWRYPGKSQERDPVPREILVEVQQIMNGI